MHVGPPTATHQSTRCLCRRLKLHQGNLGVAVVTVRLHVHASLQYAVALQHKTECWGWRH